MTNINQISAGVVKLENGLYYFSASRIAGQLRELGLSPEEAAEVVGLLTSRAIDAEQLFTLRTLARPQ